jgi:superfamily II DNA or RNA helicase
MSARGTDGPMGRKARARPASASQPAALGPRQVATVEFDRGSLLLSAPRTARVPRYLAWDERVGSWRTEALNHAQLREDAAEYRLHLEDHAELYFDCPPLRPSVPPLRPDQEAAIAAWEDAGQRGVIVKPTGTGKTEIALGIIARHRVSTLVIAPLRDLMYQWQRRIRQGLGFEAGVLGDGRREIFPITVTTYDSAWIHMKEMGNRYRLVVFDEAHHLPGPSLHESALDCLAPMRLGLTATPQRADGRERLLDSLIGPVAFREEIPEAKGRTLADYSLVRVPIHLAPEEQAEYDRCSRAVRRYIAERHREEPDFRWTELTRLARTDSEARDVLRAYRKKLAILHRSAEKLRVVEDVLRLHPEEQCVIFTASNRMALDVSTRFLIPALTSHSDKRERNAVLDAFAHGTIRALAACEVLNEGWDAPALKVGVVLGGEKGVKEAVQRIGRLLRRSGDRMARLYEVVIQETPDLARARRRGRSDAYKAAARLSLGTARQLDLF